MSLYQKHRPQTLADVQGNRNIVTTLKGLFETPEKMPHTFLFHGPTGCVDCDTEFLSPTGWKKINTWNDDEVMQFNLEDKTAGFVVPTTVIKRKSDSLYHVKTKYGIDQCLSADHRVLYYSHRGHPNVLPFAEVKERHEKNKGGFYGKIETVFTPILTTEMPLTEHDLRVQVMFNADGSIANGRKKCCVSVKKKRKIKRAQMLLHNAAIEYDMYQKEDGFVRFYFIPPIRTKTFSSDFYKCSQKQLEAVTDEVFYWDAEYGIKKYITTDEQSKDFMQYALAACGLRSTVYEDIREGYKPCFVISATTRNYVGMENFNTSKVKIQDYKTKDGFEYCFTVPSGFLVLRRNNRIFITGNCGKTTIARIVAENLGCTENNLVEIDTGQFTGIDTVRDIRKSAQYIPLGGGVRVFIIDEVHRMTKDAQNAFLKILEDTPPHIYFILCTTNEKSLLPTIRGRCSQFQVSLLADSQMESLLLGVCEKEVEKIEVEVIQTIVKSAEGHPRNALTILEQVFATPERRRIKVAEQAQILEAEGRELCQALLQQKGWGVTKNILKGLQEQDPEGLRRMVLGYMKAVLLNTDSEQAGYIMECFIEPFYNTGFPGLVYASYQVIKN